jgi:hypothetical protein
MPRFSDEQSGKMTYCCPELERFMDPSQAGLGLVRVTKAKIGTRFILEYRKDWHVPRAEAAIQIKFCPFCGSELAWPLPKLTTITDRDITN